MNQEYDNTNRGALFRNERRESDSQPTHTGTLDVDGTEYWLSAWVKESKAGTKYFSLSVKPKEKQQAAPVKSVKKAKPAQNEDDFSDVPW